MLSEDELAGVPLLVFCNKQDIEGALKPEKISEKLGLAGGETKREWSVRGSCATKGEGLEEGLDWYVLLICGLYFFSVFPVTFMLKQFHRLVNAIQKK
jgi:signal recognition particle receptor subunit beta